MRTLRHPIVMFVVTVLAVIGIGVGVLAQATPGQHRPLVVSAICAQGYHSLSDIARASMEVVTVSVQPQPRLVTVAGIPFTLTDVRVISSLKGSLSSGDVVSIRELGPRGTAEPSRVRQPGVLNFCSSCRSSGFLAAWWLANTSHSAVAKGCTSSQHPTRTRSTPCLSFRAFQNQ